MLPLLEAMENTWNMVASLGLPWWHHMIVRGLHEHCSAAEVIGSRKTMRIPRIRYRPSDPIPAFKICRRRYAMKIVFAMKINKAQGWSLKRAGIYPLSPFFAPMASCMWHFAEPLHLTSSLLQYWMLPTAYRNLYIHNIKHFMSTSVSMFHVYK
jgi:hypothetical protein